MGISSSSVVAGLQQQLPALAAVSDAKAIAALVKLRSEDKPSTQPATSGSIAALLRGKVTVARHDNAVAKLRGANVGIERAA